MEKVKPYITDITERLPLSKQNYKAKDAKKFFSLKVYFKILF